MPHDESHAMGRLVPLILYGIIKSDVPNVSSTNGIGGQADFPNHSVPRIPSCDLGTCGRGRSCSIGSIASNRSLGLDGLFNISSGYESTSSLGKRLFTYMPGSQNPTSYSGKTGPKLPQLDAYIPAVDNGAEDGYFHRPLPTIELDGEGSAVDKRAVSQQSEFGEDPFQIISTRIYGCTVAHLWQSYSNDKYNGSNNVDTPGDPAFNQRVLMFLKGERVTNPVPNKYKGYIAPTAPGNNADLYNRKRTDQTRVKIFTPCNPGDKVTRIDCLMYPNRYGGKGEVAKTIINILDVRVPSIVVIPYVPLNVPDPIEEKELGTNNRGAVLFQYDPNSDGKGKKAWRLFLEKKFVYLELP
ncbi:hypothetical protein GGR58DRAFT_508790 [Xylaria digitata]|nr:hypothetical protein GGR58DRAFT_508790 [Xylaria digitata]